MVPRSGGRYESTKASDIWMFGVVLFELFSRKVPYYDAQFIPTQVIEGKLTLKLPAEMPFISSLMQSCLSYLPTDRPSFQDICQKLKGLKESFVKPIEPDGVKPYKTEPQEKETPSEQTQL